ncbi:hypothetical protein KIL84_008131 [Mauremys mutica]|uniref:Uncharacterized protein n=1 Tax=Mauremys mutica TaxID=74926 RepID=A0A9D4AQM8_9SAUR|nr:hypothetical protein KIL84_008131 [Mauremys mutica]
MINRNLFPFDYSTRTACLTGFGSPPSEREVSLYARNEPKPQTSDLSFSGIQVFRSGAMDQPNIVQGTNASNAPQDHPFVQKSAREVSLINNVDTKIQVARKRATVLWDRSLEDVIEDDDDLTVDNNETHEEHDTAKEMPEEEEENKVIIGKEDYLANTVTTIKRQMPKENSDGTIEGTQSSESVKHGLDVGRKRCFESKPTQEEEPPTTKDTISTTAEQGAFRKNLIPMSEQKQKFAIRKLYHLRRRKSAKLNAK